VPVFDRSGSAAKREGCGSGWRIWRNGLADGLWTARVGDPAFEGDDHIGCVVHGHVAIVIDLGDQECGAGNVGFGECSEDQRAKVGAGTGASSAANAFDDSSVEYAASGNAAASNSGDAYAGEEVSFTHAEVAELADALA
jgi:hypothetical protein